MKGSREVEWQPCIFIFVANLWYKKLHRIFQENTYLPLLSYLKKSPCIPYFSKYNLGHLSSLVTFSRSNLTTTASILVSPVDCRKKQLKKIARNNNFFMECRFRQYLFYCNCWKQQYLLFYQKYTLF